MSTVPQVMKALKAKGSEQTRQIFARHGADPGQMYGVKVGDLKVIAQQFKDDYGLTNVEAKIEKIETELRSKL